MQTASTLLSSSCAILLGGKEEEEDLLYVQGHVHRELRPEDTVLPCENEGSLVAKNGLITRHSETQHTKPDQCSAP